VDESFGQFFDVHFFEALFDALETEDEQHHQGVFEFGVDYDVEGDDVEEGHEGRDG
jgi:hypothetical protein